MTLHAKDQPADPGQNRPSCVTALESIYGPPSDAGFGSSVFYSVCPHAQDLEKIAQEYYQRFVGKKMWERIGGEQWLGQWAEVYRRSPDDNTGSICTELRALGDREARMQADLILNVSEKPEAAQEALAQCFDSSDVAALRIYKIGDGEAMSGLLTVGMRDNGDTIILVILMD